jgi:hypothetical protein
VTTVVELAWSTVKAALPDEPANPESPAKLADTPVGYVPALIPDTLTPVAVATPEALVVAVTAGPPLTEKLIVLPLTAELSELLRSVADSDVEPPYVPLAVPTVSVVDATLGTVTQRLRLSFAFPPLTFKRKRPM